MFFAPSELGPFSLVILSGVTIAPAFSPLLTLLEFFIVVPSLLTSKSSISLALLSSESKWLFSVSDLTSLPALVSVTEVWSELTVKTSSSCLGRPVPEVSSLLKESLLPA